MTDTILEARDLCLSKPFGRERPSSVVDVSLAFANGSQTLFAGDDCCGKNLLLHSLALLERPDSGEVIVEGVPTAELADDDRAMLQTRTFGVVFSSAHLLPQFSVTENVAMPLFKALHAEPESARKRTEDMLELLGMSEFGGYRADQLDAVERYLVALARALIVSPQILVVENGGVVLGDEGAEAFFDIVLALVRRLKITLLWAAGDRVFRRDGVRIVELNDGRVVADSDVAAPPSEK